MTVNTTGMNLSRSARISIESEGNSKVLLASGGFYHLYKCALKVKQLSQFDIYFVQHDW
jgi:hypothetical protein